MSIGKKKQNRMVRGYLLDADGTRTGREVTFQDELPELYKLLNCDCITVTYRNIGRNLYDIIADDEGLFKKNCRSSAINTEFRTELVGNLLVVNRKHTRDGYVSESLTDEDIELLKNRTIPCTMMSDNGSVELARVIMLD